MVVVVFVLWADRGDLVVVVWAGRGDVVEVMAVGSSAQLVHFNEEVIEVDIISSRG